MIHYSWAGPWLHHTTAGLGPGYTPPQLGWALATLHYSWAGPWLHHTTAGLGPGYTTLQLGWAWLHHTTAGLGPGYTTLQLGWALATPYYSWAGPWLHHITAGLGPGYTMLAARFSLPSEPDVNHKFDITVTQKVSSVCCISRPQSTPSSRQQMTYSGM